MKKYFLSVLALVLSTISMYAQAPAQMNYQAVVRNSGGNPLSNATPVSVRFTIHNLNNSGSVVFTETQSTTTNQFGLVNLQIGVVSGNLSSVNWSTGAKFLQVEVEINNSGNYLDMGTSQLISVPYALYAANSAPGPQGVTGATGSNGIAGSVGPTGLSLPGATGSQGIPGVTGPTGPVGNQGPTGAGLAGPQGITGATGNPGSAGPVGPTGAGLAGATGADGPTGPAGVTGANGNDGPTGLTGGAGSTGPLGPTGAQGNTGVGVTSITDSGNGTATVLLTNGNSSVITLPAGPSGATGAAGPTGSAGSGNINGILNYVARFTPDGLSLGTSQIFDNGTNVGIGTITPTQKTEILSSTADVLKLTSTFGNTGNHAYIDFLTYSGTGIGARIGGLDMGGYNAGLVFEVNNNGVANSTSTFEAMRLDNIGNLTVNNGTLTVTSLNAASVSKIVYANSSGTLITPPANYSTQILYGGLDIGDVGGSSLSPTNYTGVVVSAVKDYSTSSDAAITITHNLNLTNGYTPFVSLVSINPGNTTQTNGQWNSDNEVFAIVGNITANSFDVYFREVSGDTENLRVAFMIMAK